jgi:tetratricopeptide (TPR) repeat protein
MGWRFCAAAVLLLLAAGCTSLSDCRFLNQLGDPVKARVVTEEGIALYQLALIKRGEYGRVEEVRRYFEVALRFDPGNLQAQAYLKLVDNYREAERAKRLREAEALSKKGKRSQEEDYALCVAVARAGQLAPEDDEVAALRRQTADIRGTLVALYLERGRTARTRAKTEPAVAAREKLYMEAFGSFNRALAVEPENSGAQTELSSLAAAINDILRERLQGAQALVGKGQFAEARKEAALLEELNRRLGHPFDGEIAELGYTLHYRWARSLFERRDYPAALARADSALAVRKTEEAAALRRRIQEARRQSESGVSYEAALGEADRLLAAGDLAGAYRRIDELARGTKDRARLAALEARREKMRAQLPALYEKAVGYYRAEDFQNAVELLETVLVIDVEYEQAAEYLDKARTKQKLLEQYGGDG